MPLGQCEPAMARVALELQPCCGVRSGIGTYTYELARRLHNGNGIEFQGNVFNFLGRNDNRTALAGISIPLSECRAMPYGVYRRVWHSVPIYYNRLFSHADLSLFFNYIVPPRIKGKVAAAVYDLTYLRFPETMERRNYRRISRDLAYSIDRSQRIITISSFVGRELHELLAVPAEKICVVPCAPSFGGGTVPFSEIAAKYRIATPYLLYVGTIEPRKNLMRLIRAFERLKRETGIPHRLVLAGGNGWNNQEIYRAVEASAFTEDIVFTGFVSAAEKNTLYQNAAVFVFPSLYEGFGMPPLEAMHFGCPVVTSHAASLPEVAGDAACLTDPMDELSMAEGIFRVLHDTSYRAALTAAGYVQEKKFTWEASADRLTQMCCELLGEDGKTK